MDYIATSFDPDDTAAYTETLDLLAKGSKYAWTQQRSEIPQGWTDTSIWSFFINKDDIWNQYKSVASSQNTVLSTAGIDEDDGSGITFIAASWEWQVITKLHGVGSVTNPRKPYDLPDATFYLQQWLSENGQTSVTYETIEGWFSSWGYGDSIP